MTSPSRVALQALLLLSLLIGPQSWGHLQQGATCLADESGSSNLKNVPKEEFLRRIDQLLMKTDEAQGAHEAIKILKDALIEIHPAALSREEPEIWYGVAELYFNLQEEYAAVTKYQQAIEANAHELTFLTKVRDKDPDWKPKQAHAPDAKAKRLTISPALVNICENRSAYAYLIHAQLDARLDPKTREEVRQVIKSGQDALEQAKLKEEDSALAWINLSVAYWTNSNRVEMEAALNTAFQKAGQPGPPKTEIKWRRDFFGKAYLVQALLLVERRQIKKATEFAKKAADYLQDHPDPNGMIGHVYLLIARAASVPDESKQALDKAINYLETGDLCETCRYSLACALGRKAALEKEAGLAKALKDSTNHFLYTLGRLRSISIEPDLGIMSRDPYLQAVLSQQNVKDAIKAFKWEPNEDNTPSDELWHYGIPFKRVSFTRLNGDDRRPDEGDAEASSEAANPHVNNEPAQADKASERSEEGAVTKPEGATSQLLIAFGFGVCFIIALLVLAIKFPNPTPFQYGVFRIILALAASGIAAMIPGFLALELNPKEGLAIRAAGALAVFVIVYFFNPARYAVESASPAREGDGAGGAPGGGGLMPIVFSVKDGQVYNLGEKLLGSDRCMYDLELSDPIIGNGAVKFRLQVFQHVVGQTVQTTHDETHALELGKAMPIAPPWELALDKIERRRAYLSIRHT